MKGHIRERGKDTWQLYVDLRRRPGEKRKQETKTFHGKKGEARAELRKMLARVDAGLTHDANIETVEAFLRRWLDDVAKISVTPATFEHYDKIVDKQLAPTLGPIKIRDLKASHVQRLYSTWSAAGRAPATIRKYHAVLHRALKTARRWKIVSENVADDVDLPRVPTSSNRRFLSPEQCRQLIAAATSRRMKPKKDSDRAVWLTSRLRVPIIVLLETGMRRGELLALKWSDVDYARRRLTIRRAVERTKAHGVLFKLPKSRKVRVISLSESAIAALQEHHEAQRLEEQECRKQSGGYDDGGLVFAMPWGSPWDPPAFGLAFRRLAKDALGDERGNIGPHTLRHTATTLMLQQGLGPKVVADRLGHSTTRMTMDVYAHVAPELEAKAADAVAAAIALVSNPLANAAQEGSLEKTQTAQSLTPQGFPMVGDRGLEPRTSSLSGMRSNRLS